MAKIYIPNSGSESTVYDDVPLLNLLHLTIENESPPQSGFELRQLLSNDRFPNNEITLCIDTQNNDGHSEKECSIINSKLPQNLFYFDKEGESSHFVNTPFDLCEGLDITKRSAKPSSSLTSLEDNLISSRHQTEIDNNSKVDLSELLSSCNNSQEESVSAKVENFNRNCNISLPDLLDFTADKQNIPNLLSCNKSNGEKSCDVAIKDILNLGDQMQISLTDLSNNFLTNAPLNEFCCTSNQQKSLDTLNPRDEINTSLANLANSFLENTSIEFSCESKREKSYDVSVKHVPNSGDQIDISLADLAKSFLENASSSEFNCESKSEKSYVTANNTPNSSDRTDISLADLAKNFLKNTSSPEFICESKREKSCNVSVKHVPNSGDQIDTSLADLAKSFLENTSSSEFNCESKSEKSYVTTNNTPNSADRIDISLADLAKNFLENTSSPEFICESKSEKPWDVTAKDIPYSADQTDVSLEALANTFLANIPSDEFMCKNNQERLCNNTAKSTLNSADHADVSLAILTNSFLGNTSNEFTCGSVPSCERTLEIGTSSDVFSEKKVTENEIDKFLKGLDYSNNDVLDIKEVEDEKDLDYLSICEEKTEKKLSISGCSETENKDGQCMPEVNLKDCIKKQDSVISHHDPEPCIYPNLNDNITNCADCKHNDFEFLEPKTGTLGYKFLESPSPVQSKYLPVGKQVSAQKRRVKKKQSLFAKALSCKPKRDESSLDKVKNIKRELMKNYIRPFMFKAEDKVPVESRIVDKSNECVLSVVGRFVVGNEISCGMQ